MAKHLNTGKFVNATAIRALLKQHGMRISSDLVEHTNGQVQSLLDDAIVRASANQRKTVRAVDL